MVERVRNVIKADYKNSRQSGQDYPMASSPKRPKRGVNTLLRRYPVSSYEIGDPATTDKHNKAISDELKKARPRDTLLLPLLKSTYGERRMYIMNEAKSVTDVLGKYPALTRTAVVSNALIYVHKLRIGCYMCAVCCI